jgi:protein SCO1/2
MKLIFVRDAWYANFGWPDITRVRSPSALVRRRQALGAAALSIAVVCAASTFSGWFMARDERLGVVHFPISCGWRTQQDFTTATSLLHLFQFAEAERRYVLMVKHDPDCAIAYWGIAMSRLQNPIYRLPGSEDMAAARQALAAGASARTASPRERAYLVALGKLFGVDAASTWHVREVAYAEAMAALAEKYPDDAEASIFYALALNLAADPTDRASVNRTKAAELLLAAFAAQPDHPGIDHYLTYCLGHAGYQPKPFERIPVSTPVHRLLLAIIATLALSGAGIFVLRTAGINAATTQAPGGPFTLKAADGRVVTDRSLRGKWLLVYFGYTNCPNVCPTTLNAIAEVMARLGPLAEKVQPLFVTIDPERDTPETMDAYIKAFDRRIVGLSGTPAEIAAVAKKYRVFYKRVPGSGPDDYLMVHSSYVFFMAPDGQYVTLFTSDQMDAPDEIASRLRTLMGPST